MPAQHKSLRYEDESMAGPIDFSRHQGFYQVADKFFYSKYRAMAYATSIKRPVRWHFNDCQFDSIDWHERIGCDIRTLYAARARQLREKYQYLILAWSGGGDSHQVLLSFLLNDIPLDEIMVAFPFTESKNKLKINPTDTSAQNFLNEWELAMKPLLDAIRLRWPDIKITLADMKSAIELGSDLERQIFYTNNTHPAFFTGQGRYRAFESVWRQRQIEQRDYCTIFGIGSPVVERFGSWIATGFVDQHCTWRSMVEAWGPRKTEYFYWTPDMPEIVREQAHLMLDHLRMNPLDIGFLRWWEVKDINQGWTLRQPADNEILRRLRNQVMYPDLPPDVWQVDKPRRLHLDDCWSTWFRSDPHSEPFLAQHKWAIDTAETQIDPGFFRYTNGQKTGILPMFSSMYMVGRIPSVRNEHLSKKLDLELA